MWLKITTNYSPNFSLPKRSKKKIEFIIIHYTGMKNESSAIKKLCSQETSVSAHYFIKNNGEIINLVPDMYEAWHAGKSGWKKKKSLNRYSIGVEIQNQGHAHGYKNFSLKQLKSLKRLLKVLMEKYKININNVLGHSDIAPERKKDPGEKFPWKKLSEYNLGSWYKNFRNDFKQAKTAKIRNLFFKNLFKIGYRYFSVNVPKKSDRFIISAFQRRYTPGKVTGKLNQKTLLISDFLAKPQ